METESVINRFKKIHGDKYSYEYSSPIIGSTDKIKLIDNKSKDVFLYRVDRHLQGMSPNKVTLNRFRVKGSEIHGNKYDYSLVKEIKGNNNKVKIICPEHGEFIQSVSNHINCVAGCPKCSKYDRWTQEELISEFNKIHFSKYDYSKFEFENVSKKAQVICKEHGSFFQNINKHLNGQGCPKCSNNSKGEEYVKLYLEKNNIKYIPQHGFDTCKHINRLSFDFYLPDFNTCVEFDGIQHFKPIRDFGGDKGFSDVKKRDEVKNKWCSENNVKLIRIKYNQISEINDIIKNNLSISV